MKTTSLVPPTLRFGVFELDPQAGELRKKGMKIRLRGQPVEILAMLLQRPGETVTREELQKKLWPADTFVDFEQGLNNAMKRLRAALDDDSEHPSFVETLPRHGYRFIGAVNGSEQSPAAETKPPGRAGPILWVLAFGALAVVVGAAVLVGINVRGWRDRLFPQHTNPPVQAFAVLPLANLSGDPEQEYFADGMTEALITELGKVSSARVISRQSVMQYKTSKKPLQEIARELNVDAVLEGAVERSGDRVRVTVHLERVSPESQVWANEYSRGVRDVMALEDDIAAAITDEIQVRLTPDERTRLTSARAVTASRPVKLKALEAYMQGNYHFNKKGRGSGDDENGKAAKCFQEAVAEDPGFVPAYIALALTHEALLLPSVEDLVATKAAVEKALSLDPASADAHALLGDVKSDEWNWSGAEEEYRRAIQLNRNSLRSHDALGSFLHATGRLPEAMAESQRAQELDPNEDHISGTLFAQGEYDRAIELKRRAVESHLDNGYLHYEFSAMLAWKGDYGGWAKEMERSVTLFGFPDLAEHLEDAFNRKGYRGAMQVWAADVERIQARGTIYAPLILAEAYAALGNKDRAFYWMEDAYQHYRQGYSDPADGGMLWLKEDNWFAPLRSDPRFKDLVKRVGLPQ